SGGQVVQGAVNPNRCGQKQRPCVAKISYFGDSTRPVISFSASFSGLICFLIFGGRFGLATAAAQRPAGGLPVELTHDFGPLKPGTSPEPGSPWPASPG